MDTTLSRMGRVYRILRRAHGVRWAPLFIGLLFGLLRGIVWLGMSLDRVFFPELARTKVSRPIVVVGNPRTGTTFLQRFLSEAGFGAGMDLFLMLYPSLVLQTVLRPLVPLLEKLSPARFHSKEVHETSLSAVETDDVGVLFRYLDGFFLYGFFLSFDEQEQLHTVDPKIRDTSARDFAWLEQLWRRNLVAHGAERNIAKLFSLAPRLPQFLKHFPEAQVVYMARDPLSVIPSSMSLVVGVVDQAFGFWSKPEAVRRQWLDRLYRAWILLFQRFYDDWTSGAIDQRRVFIVRYDQMMSNFDGTMERLCRFLEHDMTPELRVQIKSIADKQRAYKSEHKYDLAKYGLTEEQIRKDCKFFYDTFLPPLTD